MPTPVMLLLYSISYNQLQQSYSTSLSVEYRLFLSFSCFGLAGSQPRGRYRRAAGTLDWHFSVDMLRAAGAYSPNYPKCL